MEETTCFQDFTKRGSCKSKFCRFSGFNVLFISCREITKFPNDISRACRDLLTSMLKKNPR